jgi:Domain of unknown function (DUF4265)
VNRLVDSKEDFVKIRVDLPDAEDGVSGEGLWAVKVGQNLYEVRNSPWHTLEINFLDVVKAVARSQEQKPEFVEVVRRGGHRSVHLFFFEEGLPRKDEVLGHVTKLGATYEGRDGAMYAVDLKPEVDFDAVADYLLECCDKEWMDIRYATQPQPKGSGELQN